MLTCATWVKRGIAKELPDKVELSKEEIEELMNETRQRVKNDEDELDMKENEDKAKTSVIKDEEENDELTEYDFDNYDNEDDGEIMSGAGMAGLAYFASNEEDPYITIKNIDEEDRDDFVIKPTDNLIVMGKMEEEYCNLEVHVYNEEEGSMYVHHDIMLESVPLAIEWLSFDPTSKNQAGNFIAVGTMDSHIDVWDLDVVDTIEPVFTLGKKSKKKKKKKASAVANAPGHQDAILGLSWNHNARNVLASASADHTVILWDMNECKCVHTLRHHKDKVQCLQWHPFESQSLLTGSYDQTVQVLDCRSPEKSAKSWKLGAEIEQVSWNKFSPFNFLASTDQGNICYFDVRVDAPVFQINAHDAAVTGMSLSSQIPGCLVTSSSDKTVKVWDFKEGKPAFVMSKDMKMGRIHFACACPDMAYGFCFGGEKDGLRVMNLLETTAGKQHFGKSNTAPAKQDNQETNGNQEPVGDLNNTDAEMTENAFASLSLKTKNEPKEIIKKKKKKKKK